MTSNNSKRIIVEGAKEDGECQEDIILDEPPHDNSISISSNLAHYQAYSNIASKRYMTRSSSAKRCYEYPSLPNEEDLSTVLS